MKKLMLAAVALASGVAMAIESSNVVGYQNKTINDESAGGYTWCLSTLPSVGVADEEQALSEWVVTAPEGGLWSELSVCLTTFSTDGQIDAIYYYLDEVQGGNMGVEPGWYTADSVFAWSPESAADVKIPFGMGVQIGSDCGAVVTFAGQVAGDKSFEINNGDMGGYTWTGNVTPVNLKLGDFAVTAPEGGLWSELSICLTTFETSGQSGDIYYYLDEVQGGNMGVDPGWYTADSVFAWTPESASEVDIFSGEMFQIGSDCGAVITVPSALPVAE